MKINIIVSVISIIIGYNLHNFFDEKEVIVKEVIKVKYVNAETKADANNSINSNNITNIKKTAEPNKPSNNELRPQEIMPKINRLIAIGDYTPAIKLIEDLMFQVQDTYSATDLENLFIATINKQLASMVNEQEKIELLNYAITITPTYSQFYLQLAALFLELENLDNAEYYLSIINDERLATAVNKLAEQIQYKKIFGGGDVQIPLIESHNAWHLVALIDNKPAKMILDTGATNTVVSDDFIDSQYQKSSVTVQTANGETNAFVVNVNNFSIESVVKKNFKVVVVEKDKLPSDIDGLLGVDWLASFNFVIDKQNSILQLTPDYN